MSLPQGWIHMLVAFCGIWLWISLRTAAQLSWLHTGQFLALASTKLLVSLNQFFSVKLTLLLCPTVWRNVKHCALAWLSWSMAALSALEAVNTWKTGQLYTRISTKESYELFLDPVPPLFQYSVKNNPEQQCFRLKMLSDWSKSFAPPPDWARRDC